MRDEEGSEGERSPVSLPVAMAVIRDRERHRRCCCCSSGGCRWAHCLLAGWAHIFWHACSTLLLVCRVLMGCLLLWTRRRAPTLCLHCQCIAARVMHILMLIVWVVVCRGFVVRGPCRDVFPLRSCQPHPLVKARNREPTTAFSTASTCMWSHSLAPPRWHWRPQPLSQVLACRLLPFPQLRVPPCIVRQWHPRWYETR